MIIVVFNTRNDDDQSSQNNKEPHDLLQTRGGRAQHASTRGRGIPKDVRGRCENAQRFRWLHGRQGVSRCAGKFGPLDGPSAHAAARPSATPAAVVASAVKRLLA
jgi:hypothetical protein